MDKKLSDRPLVSICIPTYNGARFISDALRSILDQRYAPLEVVFSDDASNDGTLSIIRQFLSENNMPASVLTHTPSTIGANWNYCIQHAKGKYIKFLFQDDVLLPDCISKMAEVLEQHDDIGLVASKRLFIVEDSFLTLETKAWMKIFEDLQETLGIPAVNGISVFDASLFKSEKFLKTPLNKFGEPSSFMFRKDILRETGYFNEKLRQSLDYEFCYRLLKKYKIAILQDKLIKFRLHNKQTTRINEQRGICDIDLFKRIIYKDFFWNINARNKLYILKELALKK